MRHEEECCHTPPLIKTTEDQDDPLVNYTNIDGNVYIKYNSGLDFNISLVFLLLFPSCQARLEGDVMPLPC